MVTTMMVSIMMMGKLGRTMRAYMSKAVMMLAVRMSEDDDLSDGEGERNM